MAGTMREGFVQETDGSEHPGYFESYDEGPPRLGWLLNMAATTVISGADGGEVSGIELYLIDPRDREGFKVVKTYRPYFYVAVALRFAPHARELGATIQRRFENEGTGLRCQAVDLEDLDVPNHVTGVKRTYLKLCFDNVRSLMNVKMELLPRVNENRKREEENADDATDDSGDHRRLPDDLFDMLTEIREYDVPYVMRCAIDMDIRVGAWLEVTPQPAEIGGPEVEWKQDVLEKPEPRILAFDIECTKAPLKFPNAESDEVFMISYIVDGQGFLIISRSVVSADIEDFEYTPKPDFKGPFEIFNEQDEVSLLRRFMTHCRELKPHIYVTYNGDYFDWPFMEKRCLVHGIDQYAELGIRQLNDSGEYRGKNGAIHLDAFYWVKRDSYLPQGSQGLKAVTKCKLGYDPVEVDPEDMLRYAAERPEEMAAYSVSDAVATFYLYETYVNLFIFSLCTVIPNGPEDVLRKGSGTLCEALLMVQAYKVEVVCPNKQQEAHIQHHNGHMIESETYVGGHVESLETGVYRSDLPYHFSLVPSALQKLIDNVDRDLTFVAEVEGGVDRSALVNYDEVKNSIVERLEMLRDAPVRYEAPAIYHLDVGAMYPNIILTNRLQPTAIVSRELCASCDYNDDANQCKRPLDWTWRGELNPASFSELGQLRRQLQYERVGEAAYHELPEKDRALALRKRAKDYAQKVYRKSKTTVEETRTDVTCMRENSFYVDTVRNFRDRRYEYKALTKRWKKERVRALDAGETAQYKKARDKEVLFDSLQVAHKCILNSFYGYVMRKGARWRSMPMAGIVTLTGANLIKQARELVEEVGRPLELDTDGIWCMVPASFPENYELKTASGKTLQVHYPCAMLNADVAANYTNHQMQQQVGDKKKKKNFTMSSECSIFFEVDGPYRCMVLPSSTEEGKLLKKRYAVFNHDGSLAELKGFELKRRGELELIKTFQSEIFEEFLNGDSLQSCYAAVAGVANSWLDVLDSRGLGMQDEELLELISENRSMSKEVHEYEGRKMTSLTTARRLADFLGEEMIRDKGLQCKLVISSMPAGAPVTDRAVPTAIFSAEPTVRRHYLRKWLKNNSIFSSDHDGKKDDIREILDWDYYRDRLSNVVRKIITIPAALQGLPNPVPRVEHPDWLKRVVRAREDKRTQLKISDIFFKAKQPPGGEFFAVEKRRKTTTTEIENIAGVTPLPGHNSRVKTYSASSKRRVSRVSLQTEDDDEPAEVLPKLPKGGGPAPQIRQGFETWLVDRKRRWRERRRAPRNPSKKQGFNLKKPSAEQQQPKKRPATGGVMDMLKASSAALREGIWRILEVRETEVAGEFLAFVLTELGQMHKVPLTVPRVFFAEMRGTPQKMSQVEQVLIKQGGRLAKNWHVPSAGPGEGKKQHLYEVRLAEKKLTTHSTALAALLAHPELEAAYELSTPLWFKASMDLGGTARLSSTLNEGERLKLEDVELASPSAGIGALPLNDLRVLYIFHSECPRTRRAVLALFFVKPPFDVLTEPSVVFLVCDPRAKKQDKKAPPVVKKLFESVIDDVTLRVERAEVFSDPSAVYAAIASALSSYSAGKHGATIAVVQSAVGVAALRRRVPALAEYPNVEIQPNAADSDYPTLGWVKAASLRCMERLKQAPAWLTEQHELAHYGNLPLGNLGEAPMVRLADAAFARLLRRNRHLLWASESSKPDLGRIFDDEGGMMDTIEEGDNKTEFNSPGLYRGTVSIALDLFGLAVDAVLVSESLGDAEVDVGRSHAFKILRALVSDWFDQVANGGSTQADLQLVSLYQWLCCRSSLMYSPALRRCVRELMRRVHSKLVAELKRLGVRVVHASFNKIILATNKTTVAEAERHLLFVTETLKARQIFQYLTLKPCAFYTSLAFLDRNNYGALENLPPSEQEQEQEQEQEEEEEEEEKEKDDDEENEEEEEEEETPAPPSAVSERFVATWTLAAELPELAKDYFLVVVGAMLRKLERNYSTERLLTVTAELKRRRLPEEHLQHFVTLICHVLQLDEEMEEKLTSTRRTLLTVINVREFSENARLKPVQNASCVLPDTVCSFCHFCSDLDLLSVDGPSAEPRCQHCDSSYDLLELELELVEHLNGLTVKMATQDLHCGKCRKVATTTMSTMCACSGEWTPEITDRTFRDRLASLRTVATKYNMATLLENLDCHHDCHGGTRGKL